MLPTSHRSLSHLFRWEATRRIGCPGRGWKGGMSPGPISHFNYFHWPSLCLQTWCFCSGRISQVPFRSYHFREGQLTLQVRMGEKLTLRWQYPKIKRIQKLWYWDVALHSIDFWNFPGWWIFLVACTTLYRLRMGQTSFVDEYNFVWRN